MILTALFIYVKYKINYHHYKQAFPNRIKTQKITFPQKKEERLLTPK